MPAALRVSNVVKLGTWQGTARPVETMAVAVVALGALGAVSLATWLGTAPREAAAAVAAAEVVTDVEKWVTWLGIAARTVEDLAAAVVAAAELEEILALTVGRVDILRESALKHLDEMIWED